ncbi:MAG: hypothetical protein OEN01_09960, partial [Candidatus Krumholzibacteria bacterium]|nr:hypothetical protein [Candidatus Krumholzibacteria bacterium]
MNKQQFKVNPVHSLKFQLLFGAVGLLALTLTPVSYLLINYQKRILTHDLQNTIILQARNVALSSAKALFRSDPEFELVPLVTRIAESSDNITSLVITNSDHIVQADLHLQNVGQKLDLDPSLQKRAHSDLLASGEALFEDKASFSVRTPVTSLDKIIGYVYMGYSKHELIASIRRAMTITLVCGAAAFGLGVMLSLMIFRRISNPLDVVV